MHTCEQKLLTGGDKKSKEQEYWNFKFAGQQEHPYACKEHCNQHEWMKYGLGGPATEPPMIKIKIQNRSPFSFLLEISQKQATSFYDKLPTGAVSG